MKNIKALVLGMTALAGIFSCGKKDAAPITEEESPALGIFSGSFTGGMNVTEYFISKDTANKMIQSYLSSVSTPSSSDSNLNSLIFDADALRSYLSDTTIKKVKFIFAHTLDYINSGNGGQQAGYKSGALTLIAAGYNAQGNYVFGPGLSVPNRAVPCPTACPATGTASNSLLD